MKSKSIGILVGIVALASLVPARAAISLSLEPNSQTINLGDPVSMDLVISGLGDHASPSLGGFGFFNFDLSYNSAILSAVSVAFGNHLDPGVEGSIRFSDLTTPGAIQLEEVSLESAADLNAAQPSSFTLATLSFKGVAVGLGTVSITGGSLSDETGTISLPFTAVNGQVEVTGAVVPEASTFWAGFLMLLPFGLQGIRSLRKP